MQSSLAHPRPNISAEGLHFSAFSLRQIAGNVIVLFGCVAICVRIFVATVIPLTPSNAIRVVWDIKKWNSKKLGRWLFIPGSKLEEIKQNFPDSMEQRKQIIIYWINTDPLASWRRLICGLDVMEQTELADSIRCNAEPLTGI